MNAEKFRIVCEDLLLMADFHKLSEVEFANFILDFIILSLDDGFDEEDARVLCKEIYLKIMECLEKRNCKNG